MATLHISTRGLPVPKTPVIGTWHRWADPVVRGIARGWRAFVRFKRLEKLTDEALAARGLQRHEIGRFAFFDENTKG